MKSKSRSLFIISLSLIVVLGAFGLWQYRLHRTSSEWKIYQNEKIGFEIEYPRDYQIKENENEVTLAFISECKGVKTYGYDPNESYEMGELRFTFRKHEGESFDEISKRVHPLSWARGVREDDGDITIGGKKGYFFYQGAEMIEGRKAILLKMGETEALEIDSYILAYSPKEWECKRVIKPLQWDLHEKILSTLRFL